MVQSHNLRILTVSLIFLVFLVLVLKSPCLSLTTSSRKQSHHNLFQRPSPAHSLASCHSLFFCFRSTIKMSQHCYQNSNDGWASVNTCKKRTKPTASLPDHSNFNTSSLTNSSWTTSTPSYSLVVEPIPQTPTNSNYKPFMIVLVGLPGSGKSTFAKLLEETMKYKFIRSNQDELKTRQKCQSKLIQVIQETDLCPIIDRCNFDYQQRSTWYGMAYKANQMNVHVVVFNVPLAVCLWRCQHRPKHETLDSTKAKAVLQQIQKQYVMPPQDYNESKQYTSLTVVNNPEEYQDCLVRVLNQTS